MVTIRESPMSKEPPNQPNWPPKSPHETLLTSPSGRKRLQQYYDRTSPTPSPLKRATSTGKLRRHAPDISDDDDDDEDEETLQLKLQAIEARLKLKRLQQAKAKQATDSDGESDGQQRALSRPGTANSRKLDLRPGSSIQVPVSPSRNLREERQAQLQQSPKRVLLGIDKGLRAQDVSLKRASSFVAKLTHGRSSSESGAKVSAQRSVGGASSNFSLASPRIKSFSERIAESRQNDKDRQEKEDRIQKARSRGFGINSKELESYREAGARAPSAALSRSQPSDSMKPPARKPTLEPSALARSRSYVDSNLVASTPRSSSTLSFRTENSYASSRASQSSARPSTSSSSTSKEQHATVGNSFKSILKEPSSEAPESSIDHFSGFHLTKRITPSNVLTRALDNKTVFSIPQLLKTVVSPHYEPPDIENDFVVMGIVASKSNPLNHKKKHLTTSTADPDSEGEDDQAAGRSKFMVLRLTDLNYEVDLFLFDTGFTQFWKTSIGTVVAVLNPSIMPPRNRDSGKFSLKLTSSEDQMLEVGTARDMGFCSAVKKDGHECNTWVDKRKTEICEFHVSLAVDKTKRSRMEVNTMSGFGRPSSKHGDPKKRFGEFRDRSIHETVYITPGTRNAAQLLDQDDEGFGGAMERGCSRAELTRRRFAEKEKERELAKKLGALGNGQGGEYLRVKTGGKSSTQLAAEAAKDELGFLARPDANKLGLLGKTADDVSLSPIKRKRHPSIPNGNKPNQPVGWGGAFKRGLLLEDKPNNKANDERSNESGSTKEGSPSKKKARLFLEGKGIREPGRESLGMPGDIFQAAALDSDDDDDDLEIIR